MKSFKKLMKLLALVCLIFLAGIGIGLSGGVPLAFMRRKEKAIFDTELVENKEDDAVVYEGIM